MGKGRAGISILPQIIPTSLLASHITCACCSCGQGSHGHIIPPLGSSLSIWKIRASHWRYCLQGDHPKWRVKRKYWMKCSSFYSGWATFTKGHHPNRLSVAIGTMGLVHHDHRAPWSYCRHWPLISCFITEVSFQHLLWALVLIIVRKCLLD